jgi:hypothetical protein
MPTACESVSLATAQALTYGLPVVGLECCTWTNELPGPMSWCGTADRQ